MQYARSFRPATNNSSSQKARDASPQIRGSSPLRSGPCEAEMRAMAAILTSESGVNARMLTYWGVCCIHDCFTLRLLCLNDLSCLYIVHFVQFKSNICI